MQLFCFQGLVDFCYSKFESPVKLLVCVLLITLADISVIINSFFSLQLCRIFTDPSWLTYILCFSPPGLPDKENISNNSFVVSKPLNKVIPLSLFRMKPFHFMRPQEHPVLLLTSSVGHRNKCGMWSLFKVALNINTVLDFSSPSRTVPVPSPAVISWPLSW